MREKAEKGQPMTIRTSIRRSNMVIMLIVGGMIICNAINLYLIYHYMNELKVVLDGTASAALSSDETHYFKLLETRVVTAMFTNLILAAVVWVFIRKSAEKLADKIAHPVSVVVNWASALALGSAQLEFDEEQSDLVETNEMVDAFKKMAASIQENVHVVQRVAEGDMTALQRVCIRWCRQMTLCLMRSHRLQMKLPKVRPILQRQAEHWQRVVRHRRIRFQILRWL